MWEPPPLATLWASTACNRDIFLLLYDIYYMEYKFKNRFDWLFNGAISMKIILQICFLKSTTWSSKKKNILLWSFLRRMRVIVNSKCSLGFLRIQDTFHCTYVFLLSAIFSQLQTITLEYIMAVFHPGAWKRQRNKSGICALEIVSQL
jgi:hypothetical protein